MKLYGGYATDRGTTRENNQDAVFFRSTEKNGEYFAVGAVCDGIGGLEHGEVASSMVVGLISQWYDSVVAWLDIAGEDKEILFANLKDYAEVWNETLYQYKCRNNLRTGTTMSVVLLLRDSYCIVHVGDSRVYRYRTALEPLTADECSAEISNGRSRQYLSNYMGKNSDLSFKCYEGEVAADDVFLFCSDGFYHHLRGEDLSGLREKYKGIRLDKGSCISKYCAELIREMMSRGEKDNISAGLICVSR